MRTWFLVLVMVLLVIFAALNFDRLLVPQSVYLGFTNYHDVPLGLMLLALAALLALIFYAWAGVAELRAQASSAKLLRDMEALRVSLDSQEGSRFAQLQTYLDQKLNALPTSSESSEIKALRAEVDDLALQLAQLDDYLKRKLG